MGKDEVFPDAVKTLIFSSYEPVHKFHQGFLKEVEQRLAQWSVCVWRHGAQCKNLNDSLCRHAFVQAASMTHVTDSNEPQLFLYIKHDRKMNHDFNQVGGSCLKNCSSFLTHSGDYVELHVLHFFSCPFQGGSI